MDWETLYCPNRQCRLYGVPFRQGWLVKNGSSHHQQQALCRACGRSVTVRYGTAYCDLNADAAIFETAIRALAEGHSLRSTARIVQIDKDTACDWVNRAAPHGRVVLLYLWRNLPVAACQLEEWWSFVHATEANLALAKRVCESYGEAWIGLAFAPGWRLVLAFVVGQRTQERATLLVRCVAHVTDARIPFFTSDQLPEYRLALWQVYGPWVQPTRHGTRGRYPEPRQVPPPDLRYAQVVKHRRRGHMVAVTTKVVFGKAKAIMARLASLPTRTTVHTSDVERENLTLRQHNRRLTRKTKAFSKELTWLEKPWWRSLAYDHLGLPHESLRPPLEAPEPTRGPGSPRRWKPVTPAMAAGITDHLWTTQALLSFRVPVSFVEGLHPLDHLFQPIEYAHQGS